MNRKHRGRLDEKPIEIPKLVFGIHERCPWCKGTGKKPKRKELCGACGGSGIYDRSRGGPTDG